MHSMILRTASRCLLPLLLLFSVFLVLRGHNEMGGGFVGGLVAATAFALYAMGYNVQLARKALRVDPRVFIGAGLLLAISSGILPLFTGQPFMTGLWYHPDTPVGHVGTPLFFDMGVYLLVLGVTLTIIFNLAEES